MSGNAAYVIGLDGGGTKTAAQIADMRGVIAAETQGGPSNFQIIGVEESAGNILDLVETCCHSVGCNISEIGSVVAGLTGAGRTADQKRICDGIQNLAQDRGIYLQDLKIESDARIALEAAFLGKPGIALISGTGSMVFGKDAKGKLHRAGGWGRLIGDEGSGYHIGREAVRAAARMIDGRGKKTSLARLLASRFGLRTQEEIIHSVYGDNLDLSSVARLVLDAARRKDKVASAILDSAAHELLLAVQSVLHSMGLRPGIPKKSLPLALMGGLLVSENVYATMVRSLIRKQLPIISIEKPASSPVRGAIFLAIARVDERMKKANVSQTVL